MKTAKPITLLVAACVSACIVVHAADAKDGKQTEKKEEAKPFRNVGVPEFERLRAQKKNVVLDVRTKKEFDEGHVPGAVNMDVNAPDFLEKAAKLDKSKTYLVHCAAGRRGAKACDQMSGLDFPKLYNLEGGFTAWKKAGNKPEK